MPDAPITVRLKSFGQRGTEDMACEDNSRIVSLNSRSKQVRETLYLRAMPWTVDNHMAGPRTLLHNMTKLLHTQTAALQGFTIPKVFLDCRTHGRMPHVVRQGMLSYFEALSGLWLSQPWIAASLTAREWNLPGTDTALYVSSNWAQHRETASGSVTLCKLWHWHSSGST